MIFFQQKYFPLLIAITFLIPILIPRSIFSQNLPLPKNLQSAKGGVASDHIQASRAGMTILKAGGNAADAATAVAMALAVVYPQAGNLGGGGFLLYRRSRGDLFALDFRETAPRKADRNMYSDKDANPLIPKSRIGGLAVGVPGTVRGFYHFQKKFGTLSWQQVLEPAIRLAEKGFVVNKNLESALRNAKHYFEKFHTTGMVFLPGGEVPRAGRIFRQRDLARSLKDIALHGDKAFYRGQIAREIVKSVLQNGGILSLEDLKSYQAIEREAVVINYRDYKIITLPPPSSAGVVLAGILNGLQTIDLQKYTLHSPRQIALLSELEKHFFYFRNSLLGDPDFVNMPLRQLYSPEFADKIFHEIHYKKPTPSKDLASDRIFLNESNQTTHYSIIDSLGNAVSVTYTLNGSFGSKLVAGTTGILLNNEMDDFAVTPGKANMFGLVQGEANRVEPGKRMLSSMSPTIVEKDGELVGVLGSPGGPTIITTVLQVLLNLIDYKIPLPAAVEAGRFHHQWLPDSIFFESTKFNFKKLKKLKQWGYNLVKRNHIGDVNAIWKEGDSWILCSDKRGNGFPRAY